MEHHLGPVLWHNTIHRPNPNTSTAAPTAGPASSSSNPNAQTKTVGTLKICPWATDPEKMRSTASLLPSCASPCPVCRGEGKGVVGWPRVVLLYYFCCCRFKRPPPLCRMYGNGSLPHNL